jgi:hypothetical protein
MSDRIIKIRFWALLGAISLTLSLGSLAVIHYREPGWPRTDLDPPGWRGVVIGPVDLFTLIYNELEAKGLDVRGESGNGMFGIVVPERDAEKAVAIIRQMKPKLKGRSVKVRTARYKWSDLD